MTSTSRSASYTQPPWVPPAPGPAKRIGVLTGGGDCPGLNAVIRAVVKHAILDYGYEVIGIQDGYRGLYDRRYMPLTMADTRGLLTRGGTVLGSSNRCDPFNFPIKQPGGGEVVKDVSATVLANLETLGLEALIAIGGDGTMIMSQKLIERGARIVGVPKTIDNDLSATDQTFGFDTAVGIAAEALDRLHSTAESHDRVILCEVMGRYAGWIALAAGIAGGANVILIPEIPYDIERIIAAIKSRKRRDVSYSIICVAEGALPRGGDHAVAEKATVGQDRLGGAAEKVARDLKAHVDHEIRVTVLGHVQRGGTPSASDRILATRYGVEAVGLIHRGELGRMVALHNGQITSVPIPEAIGKLKTVDPQGGLCVAARGTGVELGG
jgi:phosphofructokinase-like protein